MPYVDTVRGSCSHVCAMGEQDPTGFVYCEYCGRYVPVKQGEAVVRRKITRPRTPKEPPKGQGLF